MAVQQHNTIDCQRSRERDVDWRSGLPVLSDGTVTLRELTAADAPSLLTHICSPPVIRYIAAPPASVEGFKRFIRWTREQRRRRRARLLRDCSGGRVESGGLDSDPGARPRFRDRRWGFALGESLWGHGVFMAAARLMLDFAFGPLGVLRLEARSVEANGRGNGVLRKLGATREGTLRRAFRSGGSCLDDVMWSILAEEWAVLSDMDLGADAHLTAELIRQ